MTIYAGPGIDGKEVVTVELLQSHARCADCGLAPPVRLGLCYSCILERGRKSVVPDPAPDQPMCICSWHMNDLSKPEGHLPNCPRGQAMRLHNPFTDEYAWAAKNGRGGKSDYIS